MAATRVQSAFATGTGTKAFASNVASGNLLIAMVHWNGASGDNLNSVTDTQGNTWTVHSSTRVYNATIGEHMQIASCTAGSSAACTVTANLSTGSVTSIHIEEYNNAGGSMAFDAGNAATGSSTTLNSGNVTTTAANAMAVAMGNTANSDLQVNVDRGPTNGFTQSAAYTSYWFAADAYNLDLGAAGTYSAGWSMPGSVPWSMNIAAFKVSGGGAISLVGANSAEANSSSTGAVAQIHYLTANTTTEANVSGAGAITQTHVLAGANSTEDSASSTGAITAGLSLVGANSSEGSSSSAGAISQVHALTGSSSTESDSSSTASVTQIHALAGANSAEQNLSSTGAITLGDIPAVTRREPHSHFPRMTRKKFVREPRVSLTLP